MASSRLTEDGRCIVTTRATWCDVGYELYVIGSSASYGITPSDWVLRRVAGYHSNGDNPWGEGVDVRPAYEALVEALANGSVHPSLVEEPRAGLARKRGLSRRRSRSE